MWSIYTVPCSINSMHDGEKSNMDVKIYVEERRYKTVMQAIRKLFTNFSRRKSEYNVLLFEYNLNYEISVYLKMLCLSFCLEY